MLGMFESIKWLGMLSNTELVVCIHGNKKGKQDIRHPRDTSNYYIHQLTDNPEASRADRHYFTTCRVYLSMLSRAEPLHMWQCWASASPRSIATCAVFSQTRFVYFYQVLTTGWAALVAKVFDLKKRMEQRRNT